jgi:hypothetical protein
MQPDEEIMTILSLKARMSLSREAYMLRMINLCTRRIRNATNLEEAKFFSDILREKICTVNDLPNVRELKEQIEAFELAE